MYTKEGAARQIKKEGLQEFVKNLSSSNLSEESKQELEKIHIFVNGFPNLSLIVTLA